MQAEYAKSQTAFRLVADVLASGNAGEALGRASPQLLYVDRLLYVVFLAINIIVPRMVERG